MSQTFGHAPGAGPDGPDGPDAPLEQVVRVVRGNPTPADLAALVAVLTGVAAATPATAPPRREPGWGDRAALLRRPVYPGPGAWRTSALPRP